MMFAECGMAVYETTGIVWVENEIKGGNRVSSFVLRLRERMEQLQQNRYAIHEAMEELSIEETCNGGPYLVLSSNHNKDGRYFYSNV